MALYVDDLDKDTVRLYGALFWSALWVLLIALPPGSRAINTSYRLNFCAGFLATAMCILNKFDVIPESFATMSINTYFFVDFVNIMLNDFVFKVPSYQSPQNRKMEYFHHIFCLFFGLTSEYTHQWFSTPFLMTWRYFNKDILGLLFFVVFVVCRIWFLGVYVLPDCIRYCHPAAGWGFSIPYYGLNFYFVFMMIKKVVRTVSKKKDTKVDKKK